MEKLRAEEGGLEPVDGVQDENRDTVLGQYTMSCSLQDGMGTVLSGETAVIELCREQFRVKPLKGMPVTLAYREVSEVVWGDYRIHLQLPYQQTLTLFDMGYRFEDFTGNFTGLRNAMIIWDMLMQEEKFFETEAAFRYGDQPEKSVVEGECRLHLYDTGLVLIPSRGEIVRVPYSFISQVREGDYAVIIEMETGERYELQQMGRNLEPFRRILLERMNKLDLKVQQLVREIVPEAGPRVVSAVAMLMREGKAALKKDIDAISPGFWRRLEQKLEQAGAGEVYRFLEALGQRDRISIGIKRGLMGDLTGEYLWFTVPVYDIEPGKPGNVIAMEAVSSEGGRATYLFRIMEPAAYAAYRDLNLLHQQVEDLIKTLNACMLAVNFRREPIYLSETKLEEPEFARYKAAVKRLKSLRLLRSLYVGRVFHRTQEQWKQEILDMIRKNTVS